MAREAAELVLPPVAKAVASAVAAAEPPPVVVAFAIACCVQMCGKIKVELEVQMLHRIDRFAACSKQNSSNIAAERGQVAAELQQRRHRDASPQCQGGFATSPLTMEDRTFTILFESSSTFPHVYLLKVSCAACVSELSETCGKLQ